MSKKNVSATQQDVYTIVTDSIIAQLNNGIIPWFAAFKEAGMPRNVISGMPYSGLNVWLLSSLGYEHNQFLTWKQLRSLGASVKEEEVGHLAVFWAQGTAGIELKCYRLYNVAQCKNFPKDKILPSGIVVDPDVLSKEIIDGMPNPPQIKDSEASSCFYAPDQDCIYIPPLDSFPSNEHYYSTLFYYLALSTSHRKRLNREDAIMHRPLAPRAYSIEELTADMASSYLCSYAGINALYPPYTAEDVDSWLKEIHADNRFVINASVRAQKAVNYILKLPENNGSEKNIAEMAESEQ